MMTMEMMMMMMIRFWLQMGLFSVVYISPSAHEFMKCIQPIDIEIFYGLIRFVCDH
jgi:hypothetical protein